MATSAMQETNAAVACKTERGEVVTDCSGVCTCNPFCGCRCIVLPPPQPASPHGSHLTDRLNGGGPVYRVTLDRNETLIAMVVERDGLDVDVEIAGRVRSDGSVDDARVFSPAGLVLSPVEMEQAEEQLRDAHGEDMLDARDAADEARGEEF